MKVAPDTADLPQVKKPAVRLGASQRVVAPPVPAPASTRRERTMRRRLGEVLVERGILAEETLDSLLAEQADDKADPGQPRRRLGQMLVDQSLASEGEVADALGELLGLEVVDLTTTTVDPDAARSIPRLMAERFGLLVLGPGGRGLRVAATDPTNVLALDDVRIHTRHRQIEVVVATSSQVREHLARVWSLSNDAADAFELLDDSQPSAAAGGSSGPAGWPGAGEADDSPTVRIVDALLADAVRLGASDVHVEPQRDGVRIRYRVDGLLRDVMTVPRAAGPAMISRLKIVSSLDIAERRLPQDGRARIGVDGRAVDARVSTLPSLHGEKVVVRLLPGSDDVAPLAELGFEPQQLDVLRRTLATTQGLVLITGPTGSGKTNTLYSAIHEVMTPDRNVVTLEDPVEIQLPGITQVQVNERTGMTFARGLRAILRQDPDVVLVGEIRDLETAELALRASLTGHLVLSTLHTNSAVAALTRLVDMGCPTYLVASSLELVVAQRLVRRPCPSCASAYRPDDSVLALLELGPDDLIGATPRRGRGCATCSGTGYRGRTGVFELLDVDADVRKQLVADSAQTSLEGVVSRREDRSMRMSGVAKAAAGQTTYEEALRVTHADALADPPDGRS